MRRRSTTSRRASSARRSTFPPTAGRSTTASASSSRSARARRPSTRTRGRSASRTPPRSGRARARPRCGQGVPAAPGPLTRLRVPRAPGRSGARPVARGQAHRGARVLRRESAATIRRSGSAPPRSSATPASTTRASPAWSSSSTRRSRAHAARRPSSRIRSGARSTSSTPKPGSDGRNVYLTLDHTIQGQVERVLDETRDTVGRQVRERDRHGPAHGGMLAIANDPGYDANRFPGCRRNQRNRAVTDTYEPGSTFKIVTISGALETASCRRRRSSRSRTRCRLPTASSTTPSSAARRR